MDRNERYVREWYGKTILLPDTMTFRLFAREKVPFEYSRDQYKIAIFISGVDCISCKLRIDDWQRFIQDLDSTAVNVSFLFIMDPIYQRELYTVLRAYRFSTPVCVDSSKEIRRINNMSLNDSHIFLLDQQNRIVGIGDPIVNERIRKLYKKLLKN